MFGAAVETSCLFFSYRVIQDMLRATVFPGVEQLPFAALLASGALSGSVTSLALTPIELIKCKIQVPVESAGHKPVGPLAMVARVFRQEGLLGFWRGQLGTLIRETGGSAAWFGGYEGVSSLLRSYSQSGAPESEALPLHQQMIAGASAGMSYNFLFYPADTIKSRMQTADVSTLAANGERQTFVSVGRALWRQQGLKGMYRGCGITCVRSAPSSAFIFSVYEGLRSYFG
jgi:ornithine carrier protein